jgi:hypothetical protein
VKFTNPQLQQHFERVLPLMTTLPEEQRPICALMDAYSRFRVTHGEQSDIVREAIDCLLLPELRPGLRSWYLRSGHNMNPFAREFRDRLGQMAGETFGEIDQGAKAPHNSRQK